MKSPDPSKEDRAGKLVGKVPFGDLNNATKSPARSTVSNIVTFPGARYEQPADSRAAWLAVVGAITARDAHIAAGGGINDPEYKRLASVAVMARESYERDYLAKGAA